MDWNTFGSLASAFFSGAAFVVAVWLALKRIPDELEKLKVTRREEQKALVAEQLWAACQGLIRACAGIDLRHLIGAQTSERELAQAMQRPRAEFIVALERFTDSLVMADIWLSEVDGFVESVTSFNQAATEMGRETFAFVDRHMRGSNVPLEPSWILKDKEKVLGETYWNRLQAAQQELQKVVFPVARHEERKTKALPKGSGGST